ncbi:MAG TPA: (d)CMP kinase [Tepiditoga sp.]|nr:(d)CMP kinase [Thermotogota bacterium]HOO73834.1 (d)CMP kinase [Tepiditoga sp.]
MKKLFHIAIDGPAGSGKSTIAKSIAGILGCKYLDSGAIYRIIGYHMTKKNIPLKKSQEFTEELKNVKIEVKNDKYYLFDEEINEQIRKKESGMYASEVAKIGEVRDKVNSILRSISSKMSTVIDGRDIGTVVLPDAEFKIFLTASPEERARRRFCELREKNISAEYDEVLKEINERDAADTLRNLAPLRPAEDSVTIDTTSLSVEDVVGRIKRYVEEKKQ